MIKVRFWGEGSEIEELIERLCNELPGVRVLSISGHYKDRGASVYERVYLDVVINPKPPEQSEQAESRQISNGGKAVDKIKKRGKRNGKEQV